jgi:hypothetical protein
MPDVQAIAKRFIASLNTDPKFHNAKIKNLWNPDGSPRVELHIAIRGGVNLDLPEEFEGVPVRRVRWPKDK